MRLEKFSDLYIEKYERMRYNKLIQKFKSLSICLSILDNEEDKPSFEEIYYKYKQRMHAVAYSVLHNNEDAEDAVQNAFIAIANSFQKIHVFLVRN